MRRVPNSHQLVSVIVILAFIIKNWTECNLILHRLEVRLGSETGHYHLRKAHNSNQAGPEPHSLV